ncbi:MAG: dihydroneopterin aldolase [Planctomycetes bacterium]|nr:dihydroneopterin aldolase [Planctomycetota bacterium]
MVEKLDCIYIRDLKFRCIVGINEDERTEKQDVVTNVTLWADLKQACLSDNIDDTVDYKMLKKQILLMAEHSEFLLVEALAQAMANICLADERVQQARVCVEKPTALRFARTVGVEIVRTRD